MDEKLREAELKAQSEPWLVAQALGNAEATETEATSKAEQARRASEAEARARKEAEQAIAIAERATRAVVFPADSNIAADEVALRVMREAEEARQRASRDSEGTETASLVNKAKATKEAAQEAKIAVKEANLAAKAAKKAKAAEAKAKREAAQEAKREAKEAKLAAKAAKKVELLKGNVINRDEIITRYERERIANLDQGVKQAEVEPVKGVKLAAIETTVKEARETKEEVSRETEEAGEVELDAEIAAKPKEAKAVTAQLYKGTINLLLMPPVDLLQIKNLEEKLHLIQNIRVILTSGSVAEGGVGELIRIVVSTEQPIPLLDVLSQIPIVNQVTKKGKEIEVSLKA